MGVVVFVAVGTDAGLEVNLPVGMLMAAAGISVEQKELGRFGGMADAEKRLTARRVNHKQMFLILGGGRK